MINEILLTLEEAVSTIKNGSHEFAGSVSLCADLNEIGYDAQYTEGVIRVFGYDSTDLSGRIIHVKLELPASLILIRLEKDFREQKEYITKQIEILTGVPGAAFAVVQWRDELRWLEVMIDDYFG